MIELKFDTRELDAFLDKVTEKNLDKAVTGSLNKAAREINRAVKEEFRSSYKLRVKEVNTRKTMYRARPGTWESGVTIKTTGVKTSLYNVKQVMVKGKDGRKRKGVKVNVKGSSKLIEGAFMAKLKSGHMGVFKRTRDSRLPIKELYSTSLFDYYKKEARVVEIKNKAQKIAARELNKRLRQFLLKL